MRGLGSEFDVFSGDPNLVAASARLFPGVETKLVVVDQPLADALVAHGSDLERAVPLEDLAPMRFVGQFHANEFCSYLLPGELLELLFGRNVRHEGSAAEECNYCYS